MGSPLLSILEPAANWTPQFQQQMQSAEKIGRAGDLTGLKAMADQIILASAVQNDKVVPDHLLLYIVETLGTPPFLGTQNAASAIEQVSIAEYVLQDPNAPLDTCTYMLPRLRNCLEYLLASGSLSPSEWVNQRDLLVQESLSLIKRENAVLVPPFDPTLPIQLFNEVGLTGTSAQQTEWQEERAASYKQSIEMQIYGFRKRYTPELIDDLAWAYSCPPSNDVQLQGYMSAYDISPDLQAQITAAVAKARGGQ